ncbi:thioredoxin family protein [Solemya elarraichensis gill symbiont]|uniref:Thioredoxin n=1 Tax=Solemya elarraichensis gill symbiont TaxID=1918949 RepID=A0A1T2L056_9GAMM|nr:thioredoxin family protein [Solemya elarraichensis gill symbiont]OOZ38468.1 thioredoxin [Solemya elarraichensis gill symbiont]
MRLIKTLLFLLAISPAAIFAADYKDFFDEGFGDFQEELENAADEGKKGILLMFEMDECPFCHRMKRTVLNQSEVQDFFHEHFKIFTVDVEGDLEIVDFNGEDTTQKEMSLKQFRVRATPVFQFVDLDGKPARRGRYTGATSGIDEFMLFGQYLVEGLYEDMRFSKYKKTVVGEKKADAPKG